MNGQSVNSATVTILLRSKFMYKIIDCSQHWDEGVTRGNYSESIIKIAFNYLMTHLLNIP